MQLGKVLLAVAVIASLGCGPAVTPASDWMIGWFSDTSPDFPTSWDTGINYQIFEDHTAKVETTVNCGGQIEEWSMTWEEDGESTIRLLPTPSTPASLGDNFDGYLLTQRPDCDEFDLLWIIDAQVLDDPAFATPLYHARLCMTDLGEDTECNGGDCNRCSKKWCEGTEVSTCDER